MSPIKRRTLRRYIRIKREVFLMSKQLVGATIILGSVLMMAPMLGIAEDTLASLAAKQEISTSDSLLAQARAVFGGAKDQGAELWQAVWGKEERLARAEEKLNLAEKKIIELEDKLIQKNFVSGLDYKRATACVGVLQNYFNTHVTPGGM